MEKILKLVFVMSMVLLECYAEGGYTVDTVVGQEVVITCGVQVNGQRTAVVWKFGQDKERLAYSIDGDAMRCDTNKKDLCSMNTDGSLVLRNVRETDSDDYYCEVDGDKYFSQHSLNVHPEGYNEVNAQNGYTVDTVVGEEVVIPCGVQVNGQRTALLWKFGQDKERLAYSIDGDAMRCDTNKKDSCSMNTDGSLVLSNVQETDSDDYYCEVDGDKYFSQHSLMVHPKAFEICPDSGHVLVYQTGPEQMVLAYTNPSCSNTDVVGNVTCHAPSGAKIEMSFKEILCSCTHCGNLVDTCNINLTAVGDDLDYPSFTGRKIAGFIDIGIVIGIGIVAQF